MCFIQKVEVRKIFGHMISKRYIIFYLNILLYLPAICVTLMLSTLQYVFALKFNIEKIDKIESRFQILIKTTQAHLLSRGGAEFESRIFSIFFSLKKNEKFANAFKAAIFNAKTSSIFIQTFPVFNILPFAVTLPVSSSVITSLHPTSR